MKKLVLFLVVGSVFMAGCGEEELAGLLSEREQNDLMFLREEEKLAHDVYEYSYNRYGHNIFLNIGSSEQTHTTSVLRLLEMYGLVDPVGDNKSGVFVNKDLQTLYNELISKSDVSLAMAMEVGASIEDLDIRDIETFKSHTSNSNLIGVYGNLVCGSRNHMRSFVGQMGTYTPQYVSQLELDAILNSSMEKCGN